MKQRVEIASVQMNVAWLDPEANLKRMTGFIRDITDERKVDLIIFPELANLGYVKDRNREFIAEYIKKSEKIPGPTTEGLGEVARERGVYVIAGLSELHPEIPATIYNSAVLIGPTGRVEGVFHKMHIPSEEKHYFYPGSTTDVFRTEIGNIGMMVCYDSAYPELARILALKGAEILIYVFNLPKGKPYTSVRLEYLAGARATENKCFVVACNRVGTEENTTFMGRSVIISPSLQILAQSKGEDEEVLYATCEEDVLIDERGFTTVFRDRRPEMYGLISEKF